MAELKDNIGRIVGGLDKANLSIDDIKGLLREGLQGKVGESKTVGGEPKSKEPIDKIKEIFEQFSSSFKKEVEEQTGYIKSMMEVLKEIKDKKSSKEGEKSSSDKPGKDNMPKDRKIWQNLNALAKKGLQKGSIYTNDEEARKSLANIDKNIMGIATKMKVKIEIPKPPSVAAATSTTAPIPGAAETLGAKDGKGGKGGKGGEDDKDKEKRIKGLGDLTETQLLRAQSVTGHISDALGKTFLGIDNIIGSTFGGMIDKEREIIQQTRAIAYEVEGATKNSHGLNRSFENFGKTVKQTGFDRDKFASSYMDSMKIGIKDTKTVQRLTTTQLNTEKQLGLEAGELRSEFQNMATSLHMNSGEIDDMGRGMRDVARNTGLTGKNLASVVQKSEEFAKNMQNAGNLTANSYKNVIELQANFKKAGVEGNNILKALSSTNNLLDSGRETFNLLAIAASRTGVQTELMNGTLLKSKGGIKAINDGFKSVAKQFGIAGNTVEEMRANFENMDDNLKRNINISMKAAVGVEAGELINTMEAIGASTESVADKLARLNKKKKDNLTLEEKASIAEDERKIKLSKSMEVLSAIDKAAKGATNMGDALKNFSKQRGDFEGDMQALGVAWTSETDVARGAITNAMSGVNKQLKDAGKAELKINSSEIEKALKDPTALRELTTKLTKAEQEASTASKAQLDPASQAAQTLMEINDTLRNFSQAGMSGIFNSFIGKLLVPLALIATFASSILGGIIQMYREYKFANPILAAIKNTGEGQHATEKVVAQASVDIEKRGANPNSLYTHDTHLEKLMTKLFSGKAGAPGATGSASTVASPSGISMDAFASQQKAMGQEKVASQSLAEAQKIAQGKGDKAYDAALKGGKSEKEAAIIKQKTIEKVPVTKIAEGLSTKAMAKEQGIDFRLQQRINKHNKEKIKVEKQEIKQDKKDLSVSMPTQGTGNFIQDLLSQLEAIKPEQLMKVGAIIAALSAGLIVLGAAIMFMGDKIIAVMGMDTNKVIETATAVGALGAAAAAIAVGGMTLMEKMGSTDVDNFIKETLTNLPKLAITAAVLALIGPAMVLLGAAIVKVTDMIVKGFGIDISSVIETAGVVTALAGASVGLIVAASEGIEQIEKYKGKFDKTDMELLGKAAKFLLLNGTGLLLLGAAMVKITQMIMGVFRLDPMTILQTVGAIVALLGGVAAISLGIIGAMEGLTYVDKLVSVSSDAMAKMQNGAMIIAMATPAILLLGAAIMKMSQMILGAFRIDPTTVMDTVAAVSAILFGTAAIAAGVGLAMLGLREIGSRFALIQSNIGPMWQGAMVLAVAVPAIVAIGAVILTLSRAVLGMFGLTSDKVQEIVSATTSLITGLGTIAIGVGVAMAGLAGIGFSLSYIWAGIPLMLMGAAALAVAVPAVLAVAATILKMGQGILSMTGMSAAESQSIAESITTVLKSAADISGSIIAASASLSLMAALLPIAVFMAGAMMLGVAALKILTWPIYAYVSSIVTFSKAIGSILDPKKAASMGEGVASVLESCAKVTEQIVNAKDKMKSIGGIFGAIKEYLVLSAARRAFLIISRPIIDFIGTIVETVGEIEKKVDIKTAARMSVLMNQVGNLVSNVARTMTTMSEKILPITQAGWFSSSVGTKLVKAQPQFEYFFKATSTFIKEGIVNQVNKTFSDMESIRSAAQKMDAMAKIMSLVDPIIRILSTRIQPLTEGGIFTASPAKKIMAGMSQMRYFFAAVAGFVSTGIVDPVRKMIPDGKVLSEASAKMAAMSSILRSTSSVIQSLSQVMSFMKPTGIIFRSSPLKDMVANTIAFKAHFIAIAAMVRDGIIGPVNLLGDAKLLQQTSSKLISVASIMRSTSTAITALSQMMAFMKPTGLIWKETPLDKITANMDGFKASFVAISKFIKDGIVDPVIATFGDPKQIKSASDIMVAMSRAMMAVPPIIKNLATAIGLMTESRGFFAPTPINFINKNKDEFGKYFKAISEFIRDGIVVQIMDSFKDVPVKDIQAAANIMTALGRIMTSIPMVIKGLADGVIPLAVNKSWFKDAPMEEIRKSKVTFEKYFIEIAAFIRDGIVAPINDAFPDPKGLQQASRTLSAMASVVKNIPMVINGMAQGLVPLVQSRDLTKQAPLAAIMDARNDFYQYFVQTAMFLKHGIVEPINNIFTDTKEINTAARTMSAMTSLVNNIPILIKKLSAVMGNLVDGSSLDFGVVRQTQVIGSWFGGIAWALVDNIVKPIREMPGSKEFDEIIQKLGLMTDLMIAVSEGGKDFYEATQQLANSEFGQIGLASLGIGPGQISVIGGKKAAGKSQMEVLHTLEDFANQGMKKGSIYTHDDNAIKTLQGIDTKIGLGSGFGGKSEMPWSKAPPVQQQDSSKGGGGSGMTTAVMDTISAGIIANSFLGKNGVARQIAEGLEKVDLGATVADSVKDGMKVIKSPKGEFMTKVSTTMEKVGENLKFAGTKAMQKFEEISPSLTSYGTKTMDKVRTFGSKISKEGYKAFQTIKSSGPSIVQYGSSAMENISKIGPKITHYSDIAFAKVEKIGPSVTKYGSDAFKAIKKAGPEMVKAGEKAMGYFSSFGSKLYGLGKSAFENLGKMAPKLVEYSEKAIETIGKAGPKIIEYGNDALKSIQSAGPQIIKYSTEAFGQMKQFIGGYVQAGPKLTELGNNAFKGIKAFGGTIAETGSKAFATVSTKIQEIGPAISKLGPKILEQSTEAFGKMKQFVGGYVQAGPKLTELGNNAFKGIKLAGETIAEVGGNAFNSIKSGETFKKITTAGNNAFEAIKSGETFKKITTAGNNAFEALKSGETFKKITTAGNNAFEAIKSGETFKKITTAGNNAFEAIKSGETFKKITTAGNNAFEAIKSGETFKKITTAGNNAFEAIRNGSVFTKITKAGNDAFEAVKSGSVFAKITKAGNDAFNAVKTSSVFTTMATQGEKAFKAIEGFAPSITKLGSSAFQGIKTAGQTIVKAGGTAFSSISTKTGEIAAQAFGKTGAITKGMGPLANATKVLGPAAKVLGKSLPFLSPLIGGIMGATEAAETGRGTVESTILGAITGSAKTGSMFSSWVGMEEGSTGDKALGVAGSAATGAMTGAAIGGLLAPFTAGLSVPIGAAIGGVVGGATELYKWFTEDGTSIPGAIWDGTKAVGETIWSGVSAVGSAIGGIASGAASLVTGGISAVGSAIGSVASGAASLVTGGISAVGSAIGGVASGAASLVTGGLSSIWGGIKSVGSAIGGIASGAASLVTGGVSAVGSAIGSVASGAASLVTGGVSAVGSAIGSVASGAASLVTGGISSIWGGIKSLGSSIGSVASGAASLYMDGVSAVGSAIGSVASGAVGLVTGGVSAIGSAIGGVASGAVGLVTGGVSAIGSAIGSVASGASSMFGGIFSSLGSALSGATSAATSLVSGAVSTVGSIASTTFDIVTAPAKLMGSMASSVGGWLFGSGSDEKAMGGAQASLSKTSDQDVMESVSTTLSSLFDGPDSIMGSIGSSVKGLIEPLGIQSSIASELAATPSLATVVPPGIGTQDMVQRDKVTSEPGSTNVGSPELSDIANETSQQTILNEQMVDLLTKLVDAMGGGESMSSGGGSAPDADTSSRKTMNKPYMNAKWAYGAFMQTSGKQVSNIGAGTK